MKNSILFENLNFLIIDNGSDSSLINNTVRLLKDNGASYVQVFDCSKNINTTNIKSWFIEEFKDIDLHFIISEDCNFSFYHVAAFDFLISVVTTEWLNQSIKNNKHIKTVLFSPDRRHILKDYQIFVSGQFCQGPAEHLFYTELINALGGTCVNFISTRTTHIIAIGPNDTYVKAVIKKTSSSSPMKFVYPTWLVECFKTGKLVETEEHTIEINDPLATSDKLSETWERVIDISFSDFQNNSDFLSGKRFLIGMDLSTSPNTYIVIQQMIKNYGGTIYHQISESNVINHSELFDCFLGYTTKSKEYDLLTSSDPHNLSSKSIGNIVWLFNMWSMDQFIPSVFNSGKIIFRPFSSRIFTKKSLIVAFTNYFGQQRFYIQRLVDILGGISTTQLSKNNTHLISRLPIGKKYQTAKKWGSCVVSNHLWLERCCKMDSKLDPQTDDYQEYDAISNDIRLSLGQMHYGDQNDIKPKNIWPQHTSKDEPIDDEENITTDDEVENQENNNPINDTNNDHIINKSEKKLIQPRSAISSYLAETNIDSGNETFYEASDIIDKSQRGSREVLSPIENVENSHSIELFKGLSSDDEGTSEQKDTEGNQESSDRSDDIEKTLVSRTTSKLIISRESSNITNILSRESSGLFSSGGSRRAAAAQAAKRLHSDMVSLNEFQMHKKSKNGSVALLPQEKENIKKHKELETKAKDILEKCSYYEIDNGKKVRRHIFNLFCVTTGCNYHELSDLDITLLELMGIRIYEENYVDKEGKINCLIAPKIMRTAKFLKALGFRRLKYAIVPNFITDLMGEIHKENPTDFDKFKDMDNYLIDGITREFLDKAKNPKKLFERAHIFELNMVHEITGGPTLISSILKEHGIQDINVLSNKDLTDFTKIKTNEVNGSTGKRLGNIKLTDGTFIRPPKYVLVATKPGQVKKFKNSIMENDKNIKKESILVVNWDWCVDCIFNLDVDYTQKENTMFSSIQKT